MKINCETAKKIDIPTFLSKMGKQPVKETSNSLWYLSVFRNEKTASFKICTLRNRWYDHGLGVGGNLIDLVVKLNGDCTVKEALQILATEHIDSFSFHQPTITNDKITLEVNYKIKKVKALENVALIEYLKSRCIDVDVAKKYCSEIYYSYKTKDYFSIAFKNDLNGYETRNKFSKISLGKKSITSLKNDSRDVLVFEGFMDFLSFKTFNKNSINLIVDFIILNSTALVKSIIPILDDYQHIHLYLDNDDTGKKATRLISNAYPHKVKSYNHLYADFNDLNEQLIKTNL